MGYYDNKRRNLKIKIYNLAKSIAWQIAKDRGYSKITPEIRMEAKQIAGEQLSPKY